MENASKALLIAAAILIVIILIAMAVGVLNSGDSTLESAEGVGSSISVQTGNAASKLQGFLGALGNGGLGSKLAHNNKFPQGGKYTTSSGNILTQGQNMPATSKINDVYEYGDYKYTKIAGGWNVGEVTNKNKTSYGEILEEINKEKIISMRRTFVLCSGLKIAPKIPKSVTSLTSTFFGCSLLTTAPEIHENVKYLDQTFQYCRSLTGNIKINANPIKYDMCFEGTKKEIKIIGSCSSETKQKLVSTADNNNVSY